MRSNSCTLQLRAALPVLAGLVVLAWTSPSTAGVLVLDPAASHVTFLLDATLHEVHGSFGLLAGEIRFDPAAQRASGRVVLDARSAETGLSSRDNNLKTKVLESDRYPEIVFTPERLEIGPRSEEEAEVTIRGQVEIHGSREALAFPAHVTREGEGVRVQADFQVPYVAWGLRDPSVFILKVAPEVSVHLDVRGRLQE